jgi:hypothetical protein
MWPMHYDAHVPMLLQLVTTNKHNIVRKITLRTIELAALKLGYGAVTAEIEQDGFQIDTVKLSLHLPMNKKMKKT